MVTAYDYAMARLVDAAGVEGILVGDSMSMVVQGHDSTLPVTLDEMIYHAEMVGRAVEHALVDRRHAVSQLSPGHAPGDRKRRTHFEGDPLPGREARRRRRAGRHDRRAGLGRHSRDGPLRTAAAKRPHARRLQSAARRSSNCWPTPAAAQDAGAFAIVLECIPRELAKKITSRSRSPRSASAPAPTATARCWCCTICWASRRGYMPQFVKAYADLKTEITRAVTQYRDEVRSGDFRRKSMDTSELQITLKCECGKSMVACAETPAARFSAAAENRSPFRR